MIDALLLDCEQTEGGVNLLMKSVDLGSRLDVVPLYELGDVDLGAYRGLLIGLHADQRYLLARKSQLEAFLQGGGTIVFCGHVAYPFLDELAPYQAIPGYTVDDLEVARASDHPVWAGVDPRHLTWRRGVAGFYGRGANPPPAGARVVNTLGRGRYPVDFEVAPGVGGRLLVHAGADLWSYTDAGNSAERMVPQLFDWIAKGEFAKGGFVKGEIGR
ncbi:hypothetical protein [Chelatococcus asaccharovorans]|uniref:hypothetical protein n=1 Tax=Chelatococcus asaccharovorans TaxID=28210 RepID=UPI00224C685F|nr:hypothetical protein [Chelatococcus asaccharovorans]CAH1670225.1 conserved hypothetical protein [Chelatococcus asaccharovorans]CAH1678308.1 conserved hypothetical protein [Chelatococcus asaccharovorans]